MLIASRRLAALVLAALTLLSSQGQAQERGSVAGQVVNAETSQPLVGVQVTIAGTTLGSVTNQQGRFLIANVPTGVREVRATLVGFSQVSREVNVTAGAATSTDFQLPVSALQLEAVVVTATGELQRVRERGNVVAQIPVADLELASITRLSDVLQGRSAGVVVSQPSGTTGSSSRIRIRGGASASLSNNPLLVIDGVRIDESAAAYNQAGSAFSISLGGQSTSRLEDLNPEEIESIEILKGPAAAALYGTAAATGVIQVTTRRGRAGPAEWNVYSEQGLILERNPWRANYLQLGLFEDGSEDACYTFDQAEDACTPTQLLAWNPLMDREEGDGVSNPTLGPASPFRDGNRQTYGLNVSGGNDVIRYFLSGEIDDEKGIYQNNNRDRVSLRANLSGSLRDDLEVTLNSGWITSDLQVPWGDNIDNPIADAITGAPEDDDEFRGYATETPATYALVDSRQGLRRLIGSLNATYQPLTWLSVVGTAGLDVANRHDSETVPPETLSSGDFPEGSRESNRIEVSNYTANLGATATTPIGRSILSTTSGGAQYHQEIFRGTYGRGAQLLAGTSSLAGANARLVADEQNEEVVTLGAYVQQQFGFNDRLFVTAAIRGDDNSAFGTDFGLVWYPSLSASWIVTEESWLQDIGWLNTFRLRGAFGRSGLRPGFRQALTYYKPVGATVASRDVPAFSVGGVGDPALKPELSTEVEVGFDLGLLNDRVGFEFTYYDKTSEDALVSRRLAPSLGLASNRFENIGEVENRGLELLLNADLVESDNFRWDAAVSYATNHNELVAGPADPITVPGSLVGSQRHVVGYPLGGFWYLPYEWEDPNGDGLIAIGDVTVADTVAYAGQPLPTRTASLSSSITLFNFLRISGLLEHQGGHTQWSGTDEWQCVFLLCRDVNAADTSPEHQARAVADAIHGTWFGYFEDADFVKLREVAVTLTAPEALAERFRLGGVSFTLSGRNLKTWTDYTGLDPESNYAGADNWVTTEFQTQPPVRQWTARVNVNF